MRIIAGDSFRLPHPPVKRLSSVLAAFALAAAPAAAQTPAPALDPAATAWMLVATALVVLMTPALAFFYGGLVRAKNMLNTMMMSIAAMGVVAVAWALLGYSLAFADGSGFAGGLAFAGLRGVGLEPEGGIPHLLFMTYQATFVVITAALISGAVAERMRFGPYLAFVTLWSLAVYAPVAHWVWDADGWIYRLGALDFAGGTVVHVNAAAAALVAALVLGPRRDWGRRAMLPHNVPFVLLGAGLLWVGWFGFNAGSALAANATAALAFTNTFLAPAAALVVWTVLDAVRTGKTTAVGAATGIVVGLVAVTPAAGHVGPLAALAIGAVAAVPSYYGIQWRARTRVDDALDVAAAHGLGGVVGALLTGVFASTAWGSPADGALFGNWSQLGIQAIALVAVAAYSGTVSFGLLKVLALVTDLRPSAKGEGVGLDLTEHGEEAYAQSEGAILVLDTPRPIPAATRVSQPVPA